MANTTDATRQIVDAFMNIARDSTNEKERRLAIAAAFAFVADEAGRIAADLSRLQSRDSPQS